MATNKYPGTATKENTMKTHIQCNNTEHASNPTDVRNLLPEVALIALLPAMITFFIIVLMTPSEDAVTSVDYQMANQRFGLLMFSVLFVMLAAGWVDRSKRRVVSLPACIPNRSSDSSSIYRPVDEVYKRVRAEKPLLKWKDARRTIWREVLLSVVGVTLSAVGAAAITLLSFRVTSAVNSMLLGRPAPMSTGDYAASLLEAIPGMIWWLAIPATLVILFFRRCMTVRLHLILAPASVVTDAVQAVCKALRVEEAKRKEQQERIREEARRRNDECTILGQPVDTLPDEDLQRVAERAIRELSRRAS